jgi:hypothetical protein
MKRRCALSLVLLLSLLVATIAPAVADVSTMSAGNFLGEYWSNPNLSGPPTLTRMDPTIQFFWGSSGSPDPMIPPDNFSARWTGTIPFAATGTYLFSLTTDDGARLWVDNVIVIDKWFDQSATTYQANVSLGAGTHQIRVEYYERVGDATVALSWGTATGGPTSGFYAEYFNNMTLSGPAAMTQYVSSINFNWGYSSPAPAVFTDYFSARYTGTFSFPTSGNYAFHMSSDDGGRVWVDGALIIDKWFPQAASEYVATIALSAGSHQVKMEYFEETGVAVARLWWNAATVTTEVIVDDLDPGFTKGGPYYQAMIGYKSHIFYTKNAYNVQENWGRWTPALTQPGNYQVFVFVPNNYATTHNARYTVYHAGIWNTRSVNQAAYYNAWVSLGTFNFSAGGGEYVFLNDITYEPYLTKFIGFDAVKFVYVGP